MAVNYYKKDKKTGKWVVDEEMTDAGAKRSAQKPSVSVADDVTTWEEWVKNRPANLAAQDSVQAFNTFGKAEDYTFKNLFKLGGSDALQSERGLYGYTQLKQQLPQLIGGLQTGNPNGMDTAQNRELMGMLSDLYEEVKDKATMLTARTGGLDTIDTTGMKKSEVKGLERMDNLAGRDDTYARVQQFPEQEEFEANRGWIFEGMSEKDYLDQYTAYLRNEKAKNEQQAKYDKWQAEADERTAEIMGMPDYDALSQYRPDAQYLVPDAGYLDGYDFYTDSDGTMLSAKQYTEKAINETLNALVAAGNDPEKIAALQGNIQMLPGLMGEYNYEALPYMTDNQRGAFFALYNSGDTEGAKQYLKETLDYGLQKARYEDKATQRAEYLEDATWWEKAIDSAATVPANLLNEAAGAALAVHGAVNPEGLKDFHEYSPIFDTTQFVQDIRGKVGQDIAEGAAWANIPGTNMNLAQMGYNALMSGADSALNAFLFGGAGAWAPTAAMGAGAFASEYQQGQDYWDALASGAIEAGTEYIPFDIIGSNAVKPGAKVLFNMIAEGAGESTAEILNVGYDAIKNGPNSEASRRVDELITQGYTPRDAIMQTVKEYGLQVLESGITGAMSGVSAAPTAVREYVTDTKAGKNLNKNEGVDATMEMAETLPVSKAAKEIIARYKAERAESKKGETGETVTEDKASVSKEDADAEVRETEMAERDRAERAGEMKDAVEEDAAAVTKEDADAIVREAEQAARDRAEAAEGTKGDKTETGTIDIASITKAYAEAYKNREQAAQARKAAAKKQKPVSNAEIGYVYREVMRNLDKGAQQTVTEAFSRDVVETELAASGYRGDMRWAADVVTKFINGNTGRNIIKALESNEVVRQVALDFMGDVQAIRAEYRSKADSIAQRASKDFVKPETTKAEKGAQEATQGIDDRAAITEDDVFAMTDEDIDVEIAEAEESTVDGKAVTIEGVAKVAEDGSVTYNVKDADGNVSQVSEADVAYGQNDGNVARLAAMAKDLGKNAETLLRSYAEGQDVYEYTAAFKQAMQYGEDGRNIDVVKGYSDMQSLNEGQIAAAYELGRGIRTQRNNAMVRKNVSGITVGKVDTSGVDFKSLTKHQRTAVHTMSRLAKAAGFNIKFVESKANAEGKYTTENGSWDPRTLTLTLDVHAGSNSTTDTNYAMMHTAGHELTHYIRQFADGDLWNAYQEFVVGHLSKKDGKAFDLETKIQNGMKRGLDRDAAIEEVIADASGEALNSITEADIQALADTNPGLLNKVKQFISRWIKSVKAAIKAAYQGTKAKTEAAKQMMDAVDEMGKRWNELLVNATKNKAAGNVASETTIPGVEVSESGDTAYAGTGNDSVNVVSEKTPAQNEQQSLSYTHIDQRTFDSVADTDTELFCSEVDEAQIGMAAAANILLADLENSMPGQKVWLADGEVSGQKRQTSELLGRMKDDLGLTWDGLKQRLQQFAGMETSEQLPKNNLNNRRIELYLHEMLTEGYTALDGTKVNAWDGYIDSMQGFEGADAQKKYSPIAGAVDFADYAWPGEVKYSPRLLKSEVVAVQSIGKKSVNVFNSEEIRKTEGLARRYLKEIGAKSPFFRAWFGDWRAYDTTEVQTANIPGKERGAVANEDTGWEIQISRKVFNETRNHKQGANVKARPYLEYINDIVKKAVLLDSVGMEIGKTKSENSLMMHSLYAVADIGDGPNLLKLYIEEMNDVNSENTGKRSYQLQNIENQRLNVIGSGKSLATSISTADVKSVADLVKVVKRAGDLQDSKTVNPKMLNPDGTPKVMYHGSPSKFNVFDKRKAKSSGLYGRGFYFTDSKSHGSTYGELYEVYLSIKHPITPGGDSVTRSQVRKFLEAVAENEDDYSIENYGTYDIDEILRNVYRKDAFAVIQDVSATAIGDMVEAVKLFNDVNGTDFDGIVVDTETVAFEPTQIKSATNNIGTFDPENPDIRYSTRDYDELSDRELLVQALETELTPAERDHLERYKKKVDGLGADQTRMEELTSRIAELRKAGYTARTSEELRAAETNVATLRKRIDRKDKELKGIESADMIREIVRRNRAEARKQAYALARQRADKRQREAVERAREVGERRVQRLKDSQLKEKYRKQILGDVKKLHGWVASPTNKGSVPEFLREPLAEFIDTIDFSSARALRGGDPTKKEQKFAEALDKVREAVSRLNKQYSGLDKGAEAFEKFIDLPADYADEFDALVSDIKAIMKHGGSMTDTPFNMMSGQQLKEMAKMFRILKSSIQSVNKFVANARYESARQAANDTIDDANDLKARIKTNKALELLNSTFNWKNTTPYYVFQRLGRGGKAVFEGLQDGWDKMARNSALLIEFAKGTFTAAESKAWSSEITEVTLDSEDTIQMTTAQKMSLYCHTKREQSRGHLMGGGIRVSDIDGKRGTKISQVEDYVLTEDDIARIIDSLTDRQREVADKLQHFMNTQCSEWGNEISMKRFGFEQMTEKNYFPIKTDSNNRASIDESKEGSNSMFRLLNMSSLKPLTPGANNAIIIEDIFNVFSDHASDMAKYNALALPILDFIKWYNYVEKNPVKDADGNATGKFTTRSTQKALERAFGKDAKSYLTTFVKDLNAEHDGGRDDHIINRLTNRAKLASVGANMRVYLLQITSAPRAAYAIKTKYLLKGVAGLKNKAEAGEKAKDKVGILQWKDLGFFSTDINRSVRTMVRQDESNWDKARNLQMAPASWGDALTANIIFNAVKAEMRSEHPTVKPGTDAYDQMVNRRVREIVYKTQVVDSTMTRSQLMRSKGVMSMFTSFMSEPTLTVNMLNESIQEVIYRKRGGKLDENDLKPGKKAAKAWSAFIVCGIASTLVASVMDAFRDDDEYETFLEKYLSAMANNAIDAVNIPGMLPILSDFSDAVMQAIKGNDFAPTSLAYQTLTNTVETVNGLREYFDGKRTLTNVIYSALKTFSYGSGYGMYNAVRDAAAVYNTVIANGTTLPKIQNWRDSKKKAAEAMYEAALAHDTETFDHLTERALLYGIESEDLESAYINLISDDYLAGQIDATAAKRMIQMYGGKTPYQAQTALDKLNYQAESGEKLSDIEKNYVTGKTDKAAAKAALTKYGDMTTDEADAKILTWDYEKDAGRKYSDISNAYIRGEIKRSEIKNAMIKYGGKSNGEAEKTVLKLDYQIKTERPWSDIMKDYHKGRFTSGQVKKFLMDYDGKDEAEAADIVDKYDWAKANGGSTDGYSKYVSVHEAIDNGRGLDETVEALVAKYTARGKTRKEVLSDIRASITSKYKPIYLAASKAEQAQMRKELLDVYVKLGGNYNTYYKNMTDKWFED